MLGPVPQLFISRLILLTAIPADLVRSCVSYTGGDLVTSCGSVCASILMCWIFPSKNMFSGPMRVSERNKVHMSSMTLGRNSLPAIAI